MPLSREQDWQNFFKGSAQSSSFHDGRLEAITSSLFLNQSILRISTRSFGEEIQKAWWLAGYLTQQIGTMETEKRWEIPLNRKIILIVDDRLSESYTLKFQPVKWIKNLYLEIDTYSGEDLPLAK